MRAFLCAVGCLAIMSPAQAQQRFGEICKGTETIKIGDAAPLVSPYSLNVSIDLLTGYYCYAQCLPEQTYRISNRVSRPIILTNLSGEQLRQLSFDRKTAVLLDHQIISVFTRVERTAQATCKAAPFHKPMPTS
jgi:hypothetical protein